MTLVSDLHYFAPYTFYLELSEYSHCVFDEYMNFEKRAFQNRCTISGANGAMRLSIPLVGGRAQRAALRDIKILNSEKWQLQHWRSISSAYNKSPWMEYFRSDLEHLYGQRFEYLVDWNWACFRWACARMAIPISASGSEAYHKEYDPATYADRRNHLMPSTINKLYPEPYKYPQVFEERHGFIPNLSILDYLFCVGNRPGF